MGQIEFTEKVLVVDDEPVLLGVLKGQLEDAGYLVVTAENGKTGLEKYKSNDVFLIISDLNMPVMDGNAFCIELRKTDPIVPFVLLTGYGDKESTIKGMRAGVNDLIDKPWSERQLLALVERYKNERQVEIENEARQAEEVKSIFIEEARVLLDEIEEPVMNLEKADNNKAELNTLFRRIHTIKGSAGAVPEAGGILKLAHAFEDCLSAVKDGRLKPSTNLTDLMLESVDLFTAALSALEEGTQLPDIADTREGLIAVYDAIDPSKKSCVTKKGQKNAIIDVKSHDTMDEGVMVTNQKLDDFMELVGELVAFKNNFQGLSRSEIIENKVVKTQAEEMYKELTKISDQLQAIIMEVRKVSLHKAFSKFPRAVRQISADQQKQIRLTIKGDEIEVDKKIAKSLASSMIHIVRNSCDHGIESPEVRIDNGKEPGGQLSIEAYEDGDLIKIQIEDDGAGLDRDKILKKAVERGNVTDGHASSMSDTDIYSLIFMAGFSTAKKVTDVSGRGVGMDAVKDAITALGGHIVVDSTLGQGTTLTLVIPTPKTVMVEQVLVVQDDEIHLAIPLNSIADIKPLVESDLTEVNQGWTCQHRGMTIPVAGYKSYISGMDVVGKEEGLSQNELVVVITYKDKYIGIRADKIVDHVEAVVRPFDEIVKNTKGFSGYTLLDGDDIGYVLSTEEVIQRYEKIG